MAALSLFILFGLFVMSPANRTIHQSRRTKEFLFTNADLPIAFENVEALMDSVVQKSFVAVCEAFIFKNLRLPSFGIVNFDVIISAQALLEQERRHLRSSYQRATAESAGNFLALNLIVTVEYTNPSGDVIEPDSFHRYLRLVINTRGTELARDLTRTGVPYFQNIKTVGTHSSKIKVESIAAALKSSSEESVLEEAGGGSEVNSLITLIVSVVAAAVLVLVVTVAFTIKNARLKENPGIVSVSCKDQVGPFTLEELADYLGDTTLSYEERESPLFRQESSLAREEDGPEEHKTKEERALEMKCEVAFTIQDKSSGEQRYDLVEAETKPDAYSESHAEKNKTLKDIRMTSIGLHAETHANFPGVKNRIFHKPDYRSAVGQATMHTEEIQIQRTTKKDTRESRPLPHLSNEETDQSELCVFNDAASNMRLDQAVVGLGDRSELQKLDAVSLSCRMKKAKPQPEVALPQTKSGVNFKKSNTEKRELEQTTTNTEDIQDQRLPEKDAIDSGPPQQYISNQENDEFVLSVVNDKDALLDRAVLELGGKSEQQRHDASLQSCLMKKSKSNPEVALPQTLSQIERKKVRSKEQEEERNEIAFMQTKQQKKPPKPEKSMKPARSGHNQNLKSTRLKHKQSAATDVDLLLKKSISADVDREDCSWSSISESDSEYNSLASLGAIS